MNTYTYVGDGLVVPEELRAGSTLHFQTGTTTSFEALFQLTTDLNPGEEGQSQFSAICTRFKVTDNDNGTYRHLLGLLWRGTISRREKTVEVKLVTD